MVLLSLSFFPDDESLKMVSHTKEEKQNYMQEMENRRHFVPGCLLLFFFFMRMREGSSCLADPEVCWVGVLGGCMWGK